MKKGKEQVKTRGKHPYLMRGLSLVCIFLSALVFGAYIIASGDYKSMVDEALGLGVTASSADAAAYSFRSDFQNTTEMLTERKRVATQIAAEGCVLLKNEGAALPLRSDPASDARVRVTVLGSCAYTYDTNGNLRDRDNEGHRLSAYAGIVGSPTPEQTVTTSDGTFRLPITLETGLGEQNIEINPAAKQAYNVKNYPNYVYGSEANGSSGGPYSSNEPYISASECGNYAEYSDAAIVVIGRSSGEGREYFPGAIGLAANDGATCALGLSDSERNLIEVASQISEKVVVLLNSAVAMEVDELKESDKVDAIVWIGLPGAYGMSGVAQVLSGAVSPSGHLPDTYAVSASASPAAQNFGVRAQDGTPIAWENKNAYSDIAWRSNSEHYVVLAEGLYTGYRYYETRYADSVLGQGNAATAAGSSVPGEIWSYENEVSYPFGYGLSYVPFTEKIVEGSLLFDFTEKTVSFEVDVTNEGDRTAMHVVQMYASVPYTEYDRQNGVEKSAIQLLNYEKVEVAAGATVRVTLKSELKYLASYDKTLSHDGVKGGYLLESGTYAFAVGNGAHEALNNALAKQGYTELYHEDGAAVNENGAILWNTEDTAGFETDNSGINTSIAARTSEGGNLVQNQMADADYNYYTPNTVTYLTRQDWEGTFPVAYTSLSVTDSMKDALNNNVYKFKTTGSDVVFGYSHEDDVDDETGEPLEDMTVAQLKLAAFDDERWEYLLDQVTFYEAWFLAPYGGTENEAIVSVAAPTAWQVDGPNGNVSRPIGTKSKNVGPYALDERDPNYGYMTNDMPCEPLIAATFHKELVQAEGRMFGEDNIWSGNAMFWAPGMNLHRTPFNSRNHEYYSEDPMLCNRTGTSFIRGGLEKGAILAAKHFAFNTQESYREGLSQFMEEQSARELELRGFEGLFEDANYVNELGNAVNGLGVMTSFSRVGVTGVNAHTGVMKNILRGEWGFKGLSSSDMVITGEFFTVEDAVINNVTFMASTGPQSLLSNYWQEYNNRAAVQKDPDMCAALRDNMHYYLYALANSSGLNGIDANFVVTETLSWWQPVLIAFGCALGAGAIALGAVYTANRRRRTKRKEQQEEEA